jgi:hypothetical protein
MTATKNTLHQFEGRDVQRATVKITAAGDGLSEALAIAPEEIELDEERSYVLQGKCVRVSIETDKNGVTARVHTIKTEGISPIDADVAEKVIAEFQAETKRKQNEIDGQLTLDAENEAQQAEKLDETGSPAEVAKSAADRIKSPFEQPTND